MDLPFSGRILYANGAPIASVQVRVWDRDAPGKQDDDLTTSPGVSDEAGNFSLSYDPARFVDYLTPDLPDISLPFLHWSGNLRIPDPTDIPQPFLHFAYTICGTPRQAEMALSPFQKEFRLSELPPVEFLPSRDGFHFVNSFSGFPLPFSIPGWLGSPNVDRAYGLCGGMSSSSYDFRLAGRPTPAASQPPNTGTKLQRYLFRRSIDTFGPMGSSLIQISQLMLMPDDSIYGRRKRTYDVVQQVQKRLEDKNLTVIALLYVGAQNMAEVGRQIWNNHQVLVYAATQVDELTTDLQVYDPNFPGRDDVAIRVKKIQVGDPGGAIWGAECKQVIGGQDYRPVLGFIEMPYTPVQPPLGI